MAYKEKDTKKWSAQWFETTAKGEKKKRRKRGFETKSWTGCRIGELLALTKGDISFENNQISITKTYYRTGRQDVITEPKTKQSVRTVEIPEFLKKEIKDFVDGHYGMPDDERLFPIVQEAVQHKMKRQIAKAGVKNIRVHDLRHPYVKPTTKKYENNNCKHISLCLQLLFIPSWK